MVNVSSAGPAGTIFVNEGANVNAPNSLSWGNASSIAITKLASVSWTSVLNIVSATFIYGIQ
jgi:hypothetical protein